MRVLSILFHTDLSKNSPHTLLNPLTPKSVEFLIEVFTGVAVLTEEKKNCKEPMRNGVKTSKFKFCLVKEMLRVFWTSH